MRVQHAAATGAKHIPGEIEQAKPRGVQEAGNHLFFVEAGLLGKVQGVDSIELMIFTILDQPCDGIRDGRIGGLLQNRKLGLDVAHDSNLNGITDTCLAAPRSTCPARIKLDAPSVRRPVSQTLPSCSSGGSRDDMTNPPFRAAGVAVRSVGCDTRSRRGRWPPRERTGGAKRTASAPGPCRKTADRR